MNGILAAIGMGAIPRCSGSNPGMKRTTVWVIADLC